MSARHPVLITSRLCAGLPTLREPRTRDVLCAALGAGADRFGFRLVHVSIQSNHLHLIVEAQSAASLSRGMQGLLVRVARALDRHLGRKGRVFSDRYHASVLQTEHAVRNALVYVLHNSRKHGVYVDGPDAYTSGPWFDGWRTDPRCAALRARLGPAPTVLARTWLLTVGWRTYGLIGLEECPAAARRTA